MTHHEQKHIRRPSTLAAYWARTKYVYWPPSQPDPVVRVPTPNGEHESLSFSALGSERAVFERCLAYRDQRGVALWGQSRWEELLKVDRRSVARHRKSREGPMTGVNHMERKGSLGWAATWYELREDGTRRKRRKCFSYGGPFSQFSKSDDAMHAAMERREAEERRWYSVLGEGDDRRVSRLN